MRFRTVILRSLQATYFGNKYSIPRNTANEALNQSNAQFSFHKLNLELPGSTSIKTQNGKIRGIVDLKDDISLRNSQWKIWLTRLKFIDDANRTISFKQAEKK